MTTEIISSGNTPVMPPVTSAGDGLIVEAGGVALSAQILGGAEQVFGADISGIVSSHGFEGISSGGVAVYTTIEDAGVQSVTYDGLAFSATVKNGGFQVLSAGGVSEDTGVSASGFEILSAGGTAIGTTVSSGGTALFTGKTSGRGSNMSTISAAVSSLTVESGGWAIASHYTVISTATIESGGILILQSNSSVADLSVASGGFVIAEPGSTVLATKRSDVISTGIAAIGPNGTVSTYAAGPETLIQSSSSQIIVLSGGIESGGTLVPGASDEVFSGGQTTAVTVDSSVQTVNASAIASGSILENGAVQYVFSGGLAVSTVASNGFSFIDAGGVASNTIVETAGVQAIDGLAANTEVQSGGALYVVNVGADYIGTAIDPTIGSGGGAYIYGVMESGTVNGFAVLSNGIAGNVTVAAGGQFLGFDGTLSGFTVDSGGLFAATESTIRNVTVQSGGTFVELPGNTSGSITSDAGATIITSGQAVLSGGTELYLNTSSSGLTLESGTTGFVFGGTVETGTTIGIDAVDKVANGGVAYDDVIDAGGNLIVAADGSISGAVTFSGTDATLTLYTSNLSGVTVSGFAPGDTIDFETIAVSGTGPLSAFVVSGNMLEVTGGAESATVGLGSGYANAVFSATASTNGGVDVTLASNATSQTVSGTTATPIDVPIYVVPYQDSYKLGIEVSLDGGQTYKMVELDTGASGFFASYTPDWWSSYTPVGTAPDVMTYVSGNDYTAQAVNTTVTLQTASGAPLSVPNVNVGLITTAANGSSFSAQDWNASLASNPTTAPLEDYFYGDFGLGLNDNNGIEAVLGQLDNGLANGFIINIGSYPDGASGQIGTLQIGLTDADIESYDTIIALNDINTVDTFANSGEPTYGKAQATGTITLDGTSTATNLVFDTGATHTTIFTGTTLTVPSNLVSGKDIVDGATVTLSSDGAFANTSGWSYAITSAGTVDGINAVGVSPAAGATNPGAVNTGIGAYYGDEHYV